MTERLYYRDAELLAFDATAVAHGTDPKHLILDRTAFYPTSGGQPHDVGTLNGVRVIDVVDGDDHVVHVTEQAVPLGPVHGEVDSTRRHDHMQQHTAQHLLSALAADTFGWETASVHFGVDHSTIEFAASNVNDAQLHRLEAMANAATRAAHPVTISFENAATAAGLRKPPARDGEIRVITIEGLDRSACGGTHTATTAAIGAILVEGIERVRGQVRVGFLAGDRVLARLHSRQTELSALAETVSCAVDELPAIVARRQADLKELRARAEELEREIAAQRVQTLWRESVAGVDGIRRLRVSLETESPGLLRAMALAVAPMERVVLVLTTSTPPAIVVGASADAGVHAGQLLKAALAEVGGKGGGSATMAQGTVPTPAALSILADRIHPPS